MRTMNNVMSGALIALIVGSTPTAQTKPPAAGKPACALPAEWGDGRPSGKWSVKRSCILGSDILSAGAASEAGLNQAFTFLCDTEGGPRGWFQLVKIDRDGPVSLALKGSQAATLELAGTNLAGQATQIEMQDTPATKRFQAAMVDGPGSTFTLVLTAPGKPPIEAVFSRNGLAAAVKPLRSRCGW
jgi:hypothetical protein